MSEQLAELEMRMAHQEATLNDLSDVVYQQQSQIDRLKAEIVRLKEIKSNDADEMMQLTDDVPPPHY